MRGIKETNAGESELALTTSYENSAQGCVGQNSQKTGRNHVTLTDERRRRTQRSGERSERESKERWLPLDDVTSGPFAFAYHHSIPPLPTTSLVSEGQRVDEGGMVRHKHRGLPVQRAR